MKDKEFNKWIGKAIDEIDPNFELVGNKLKALEHLIISIWIGLDIEFDLFNVRYYIGAPQGTLLISWNNGDDDVHFRDKNEVINIAQLLQHEINGVKIKDVWKEIIIHAM